MGPEWWSGWSPEWSAAWAAWVAAIGTILVGAAAVLAAVWAGKQAKRAADQAKRAADVGQETLDAQERERRERQARRVHVAWGTDYETDRYGNPNWSERIHQPVAENLSDAPIYRVRLGHWPLANLDPEHHTPVWKDHAIESVAPGNHVYLLRFGYRVPKAPPGQDPVNGPMSAVFQDAQGVTWERWADGRLEEVSEPKYLPETRAIG